jgi:predicted RNA binding protein YcfA (HicA-like mRNA interferase family)
VSPALSDLPVRKVVRALESIGFAYIRTRGSHAIYRRSDGRVVVIPEHGTIKRGTLSSILRQADLTPAEFLKMLETTSMLPSVTLMAV